MAHFTSTRPVPLGAVTTFRLVNAIENAKNAFVAWNTARVTRNALSKLSDRELNDIGLVRGDLAISSKTFRI